MRTNLPRFHNLLGINFSPFHITIFVLAIEKKIAIVAGEIVFVEVTAFPGFLGDYLLGFVVDVEDGGL